MFGFIMDQEIAKVVADTEAAIQKAAEEARQAAAKRAAVMKNRRDRIDARAREARFQSALPLVQQITAALSEGERRRLGMLKDSNEPLSKALRK